MRDEKFSTHCTRNFQLKMSNSATTTFDAAKEQKKIHLQKQSVLNRYKRTHLRTINRGLVANAFFEHKKSLKHLKNLTSDYDVDQSTIKLYNHRVINLHRYISDLTNYCQSVINLNNNIKYSQESTDISHILEGFNLHSDTLDIIQNIVELPDKEKEEEKNGASSNFHSQSRSDFLGPSVSTPI